MRPPCQLKLSADPFQIVTYLLMSSAACCMPRSKRLNHIHPYPYAIHIHIHNKQDQVQSSIQIPSVRAFLFTIVICMSLSLVRHEHELAPRTNNPLLCNQWKATEHRKPNTPSNNVIVAAEADVFADQKKAISKIHF